MPFNISTFRSTLVDDGARASLFEVQMFFPVTVAASGDAAGTFGTSSELVTFRAKATSLPGDSISQIGINYFGREIKVAGNRSFTDWSIQIINDENFAIRNSFERWLSGINSHISNLRSPSMMNGSGYQTDPIVTQFAKTGEPIKQYRIVGAFPTDVSAIDLDWGSDQIEEFSVTLAYQWWEAIPIGPSGPTTEPFYEVP